MDGTPFFSPDYATARERFLQAAGRLKAPVETHVLAAKGPNGAPLHIDAATLGPPEAKHVVLLSSGLHGVEGFFGSAVQLAWLEQVAGGAAPPAGVKIVLAHALNPYGFAWLRRWNENNVDLNRNFLPEWPLVPDERLEESQAVYDRVASFLNPQRPPWPWEPYGLRAAWRILKEGWGARRHLPAERRPSAFALKAIKELGLAELLKTLPVGQYQHPSGIFYGGSQAEETTRWLRDRLPAWTAGAERLMHLDFHTGLGAWADCKLLLVDPMGSLQAERAKALFGADRVEPWDQTKTAYQARGVMANWFRERLTPERYQCCTVEFGTYPGSKVLGALRAENQAHRFARPEQASYRWAKRQVKEAFVPASPAWRQATLEKGLAVIGRTVQAAGKEA